MTEYTVIIEALHLSGRWRPCEVLVTAENIEDVPGLARARFKNAKTRHVLSITRNDPGAEARVAFERQYAYHDLRRSPYGPGYTREQTEQLWGAFLCGWDARGAT